MENTDMEKKKIYYSMSDFENTYIPNRYKSKLAEEANRVSEQGLITGVLESIKKEL